MGLSPAEILHIVEHPEVDYAQNDRNPGMRVAKSGDVSVAYNENDRVVVTVLYNTQEEYTR